MIAPIRRTGGLALLALLVLAAPARADSYTRCPEVAGATFVDVARAACTEVTAAAQAAAAAPAADAATALRANGWTPYRAAAAADGGFDLVALRGTGVLRLRRGGTLPDLDGFAAGRELVFARPTIVGGAPIPNGAALCTSAFLIRLSGGALGGLSASHCAGTRSDGTAERRNAALRRPPSPGVVLGRVVRLVSRSAPLDALVLPVPAGATRTATAVVDRGIARPPWIVAGVAQTTGGRRVCFTGRTSGPDRCGTLRGASARPLERYLARETGTTLRCTTVPAAEGDSGGPVYTAPRADGTVRALGITTLIEGSREEMCFTPVAPVLARLGASIVTGT